jgi:peptide deformylase
VSAKTVVHYGNPILKKKCKPVKDFSQLDSLIDDMFDTMYEENGIGLAANQIDVDLQLFVVDISDIDEEGESIHVFVNAEIIATDGESWMNEGCLSVPDVRLDVMRSNKITLKYQDRYGKKFTNDFDALLARVIQHEVDHLNGNLIINRISKAEKISVSKELKTIKENSLKIIKTK